MARKHARRKLLPRQKTFVAWKLFQCPLEDHAVFRARLRKLLDLVARVKNPGAISDPIEMGSGYYMLADLSAERRRIETDWIKGVEKAVEAVQKLTHCKLGVGGSPITGRPSAVVNEYFGGKQWRQLYVSHSMRRLDVAELREEQAREELLGALDAAARFMGGVLRAILVDGYKFRRKANDCFDHAQLQYLCDESMVFVTDDEKLRKRIEGSSQYSRVISLKEFLNRAG